MLRMAKAWISVIQVPSPAASGKVRPLGSPGVSPHPHPRLEPREAPRQARPAQHSARCLPALGGAGFPEQGGHPGIEAGSAHLGDDDGHPRGPMRPRRGAKRQGPGGGDRGFPDCPPRRAREEMTAREPGRARREGRRPE